MALWLNLAVVYVVWGSTYLAIRVMVRTIPPLLGTAARFLVASALLAGWVVIRRGLDPFRITRREFAGAALTGTLLLVGGIGVLSVGEQHIPSGLAALLIASIPLWVVVLRVMHRDPVSPTTIVSVLIGFGGLMLLVLNGEEGGASSGWGTALVLSAAVLSALGSFFAKRVSKPRDVLVSTVVQMTVAATVLVPLAVIVGEPTKFDASEVTRSAWWSLAYLAIIGSLVAYSSFVWLLHNAPVSTLSTYAYVNPVVAVFLGAILLAEDITLTIGLAAAVILGSVAWLVLREAADTNKETATL